MNVVVYAAHSDDIPYSVPLFMRNLRLNGHSVEIAYVFGETDYAPNLQHHEQRYVSAIRHEELRDFGRKWDVDVSNLGFLDACLRDDYLGREVCHTGALTAVDSNLVSRIVAGLGVADLLLFPLAIGDHVDHMILKEAGKGAVEQGRKVIFYEDLPYASEFSDDEIVSYVDSAAGSCSHHALLFSSDDFEQQKTLAACFNPSQVSERYISEILGYAYRRYSADGCHERLWEIAG